ncbi:aspartyl-phosphate phosphatase Spo0E family protein [Clostridium sp. AWRP]|uniref:aspartyl-phosphate phosphatase Spo0E family protein n=1 Tax=Clostridium sp. AWRP TaxID=2212991 RepID=UPI000FD88308|nr:aspartyl-phosphate phosphatase Spo0E family protein [Clostridium sp. AWRP]AZV57697.1 Spo0E family sporulation regulatory protein-aspartic acid phosphatase [Clostridium sp. AWRP]
MEQMEKIRKELNELVILSNDLCRGEVLRLSQELDKLIYLHYRNMNNCRENMSSSLIS